MQTKWTWILALGFAMAAWVGTANADHRYGSYGAYGYGAANYGYGGPNYGYTPTYGYGGTGHYGQSGYFNRTDQFHYTNPRVTTGYGYRSVYPDNFRRGGSVNVGFPGGGVNVNWGRRGSVNVYRRGRGINIGW